MVSKGRNALRILINGHLVNCGILTEARSASNIITCVHNSNMFSKLTIHKLLSANTVYTNHLY